MKVGTATITTPTRITQDYYPTPTAAGVALTPAEVKAFLEAAKEVCPDYYAVFLTALRAGLRRGELVALQWGDIQFGREKTIPIASSWFSTATSVVSTRLPRARRAGAWISPAICARN